MPVVNVGEVRVLMGDGLVEVEVEVAVPYTGLDGYVMGVLVVLVVHVPVVVDESLVGVLVSMVLAQVEPHAAGHQHGGHHEQ